MEIRSIITVMRMLVGLLAAGIAMAQASSLPGPGRQGVPAAAPSRPGLREEPEERRQSPVVTMEAVIGAQRASVALQQASIKKQVSGSSSADHSFFSVPWSEAASVSSPLARGAADCDPMPADNAESLIRENAQRQNLAPDLLRAVISKESAFYPCAVSPKGALGLMQLMPATAEMLGVTDPFDPKQNVDAGARFLKQLLDRFGGDRALALSAYNAGPGRVDAAGGVPAIAETRNYVADILSSVTSSGTSGRP